MKIILFCGDYLTFQPSRLRLWLNGTIRLPALRMLLNIHTVLAESNCLYLPTPLIQTYWPVICDWWGRGRGRGRQGKGLARSFRLSLSKASILHLSLHRFKNSKENMGRNYLDGKYNSVSLLGDLNSRCASKEPPKKSQLRSSLIRVI